MSDTKETFVAGNKVVYEDDAKDGIFYLDSDLDSREADVFFYYARHKKSAFFEDDKDRQFTLTYKGSDTFELERR